MADIKKELNDIKNAVYGKEVRGSIHDGIKKINDEVEDATDLSESAKHQVENIQQQVNQLVVEGDSSVEAAQARVDAEGKSYPTLKARLDAKETEFSSQLAQNEERSFINSTISHKEPSFMVTIVDDDGHYGFYEKLLPLIREYNIPITTAVITSRIGITDSYYRYMTIEELKEVQDAGGEVISHTHRHDHNRHPKDMTDEELLNDLRTSQRIMKENGFNYRGVVQPYGTYDDRVLNITRQVFEYSLGGRGTNRGKPTNVIRPPVDNYDISRALLEGRTFEQVKVEIDEAKEEDGWLVLLTHVDQDFGWSEQVTRQVIEYVLSIGGKFVTTQEGIDNHGNIIQAGNASLSASGEAFGALAGVNYLGVNEVSIDDVPTDRKLRNKITLTNINVSGRDDFPEGRSGWLLTVAHNTANPDEFTYQDYTIFNSTRTYRRWWWGNSWGTWRLVDGVLSARSNEFTTENVPIDFETGKVTINTIKAGALDGTPTGSGGTLITYKLDSDYNFCYQEFKPYNDDRTFTRRWSNSAWTEWVTNDVYNSAPFNTYLNDTPITAFPRNKVTVNVVKGSASDREGFPQGLGGVLTTYRLDADDYFSYQTYKIYGTDNMYIRSWYSSGWSDWSRFSKA